MVAGFATLDCGAGLVGILHTWAFALSDLAGAFHEGAGGLLFSSTVGSFPSNVLPGCFGLLRTVVLFSSYSTFDSSFCLSSDFLSFVLTSWVVSSGGTGCCFFFFLRGGRFFFSGVGSGVDNSPRSPSKTLDAQSDKLCPSLSTLFQ